MVTDMGAPFQILIFYRFNFIIRRFCAQIKVFSFLKEAFSPKDQNFAVEKIYLLRSVSKFKEKSRKYNF